MSDQAAIAVQWICDLAVQRLSPKRIWLFGSRARCDHRRTSDIDLAFEFPTSMAGHWAAFVADVDEMAPTLLEMDLVDMATCQPQLRDEVIATGCQRIRNSCVRER